MPARGHAIPFHDWWVRLARSVLANDPRDLRTLGRDLARRVKRHAPFNHSYLSRFISGAADPSSGKPAEATLEFAQALCAEFTRLPPPVLLPRTYDEAVHMQSVAERYGGPLVPERPATITSLPSAEERRRKRGSSMAASSNSAAGKRRASVK